MLSNFKLTRKQTGFKWNNESFLIDSRISEEHLYLASRESVYHNGDLLISKCRFGAKKDLVCNFSDREGEIHKLEMRCFPVKSNWLNFTILIDDIIVYKGSAPIKGIITSIAVYLPILFLLILGLGRLLGLFIIYFNL